MSREKKNLALGSDHAGYPLKEFLLSGLTGGEYTVEDFGCYNTESVDYPDIIHPLAKAVDEGRIHFGVIMCGSGNGVNMVANKYPGVRAALCWDIEQTALARLHNDANILSLPGRFIDYELALEMVKVFLETPFEGGRHERRVNKIPQKLL